MKFIDAVSSVYITFLVKNNDRHSKFKVSDYVRISKYNNIFAKDYTANCSEEVLGIKKVKSIVPSPYVISDLNSTEIFETFYEKEMRKIIQKEFRIGNEIRRKSDR